MNRRTATAAPVAGLLAVALSGCNQVSSLLSDDKTASFAQITTGTSGSTRAAVVQLMGPPLKSSVTSFAGLEGEQLVFRDDKSDYTVTLIQQRAFAKRASQLNMEKQQ
jgi:hypothetical protein